MCTSSHVLSYYLRKIREKCLWCCCGSRKEVDLCPVGSCALYSYRRSCLDDKDSHNLLSVIEAIRAKCIECSAGSLGPCPIEDCPLIDVLNELVSQECNCKKQRRKMA